MRGGCHVYESKYRFPCPLRAAAVVAQYVQNMWCNDQENRRTHRTRERAMRIVARAIGTVSFSLRGNVG